jgi:nucleoside-diphosphate-sugar epimerase
MHVLVTGASGFVGSHLVRDLAARGFAVTGVYRREPGLAEDLRGAPSVTLVKADLAALEALPKRCDAVVHAAASSAWTGISVDAIVRDNVVATRRLLDLAEHAGCAGFIFLSSLSYYGTIEAAEVDEATPIRDPDVYGASKYLGERMLCDRRERLPGLALRLPGVVGRGARRNWLAGTAERFRRGEAAAVFNPDAAFNNAVHVADLAAFVARVLERSWAGFDAMVLGARGRLTVRGVAERLAAGMGVKARIDVVAAPKPAFTLSSVRAIERWGYDPMEIAAVVDRFAGEA